MPRFGNVLLETADMQRREWMDTKPQDRYVGRLKFCGPREGVVVVLEDDLGAIDNWCRGLTLWEMVKQLIYTSSGDF